MTHPIIDAIDYSDLEDAIGWLVQAPFRAPGRCKGERGERILRASAGLLHIELEELDEFAMFGFTRTLSGNHALEADQLDYLLGRHDRQLAILAGVAAARGKVEGP